MSRRLPFSQTTSTRKPSHRLLVPLTVTLFVSILVAPAISFASRKTAGEWTGPYEWPCVAIHMHLLPDGKILSWADDDNPSYPIDESRLDGTTKVFVVDIATDGIPGEVTEVDNTTTNLFCAGHTFLPDGRLLALGGHKGEDRFGDTEANLFSYTPTYGWTLGDAMEEGRWYPTAITLSNGEVLVVSGYEYSNAMNELPEVWKTNSGGGFRQLSDAELKLGKYPYLHLAPDGTVFISGPDQETFYMDTAGTGSWTRGPERVDGNRGAGGGVMYADGKILMMGGGNPPKSSAEVIDLMEGSPRWRAVGSMVYPRRNMNSTILPDGTVLATGGCSVAGNKLDGAVYAAELWNPETEQWTTMASATVPRLYHSTALLLPDGRVLSAGGGRPHAPDEVEDHEDVEFYSPPYLFKGARPTVTSAPSEVGYGEAFFVATPDSSSITKVTWLRLGSVTHTVNMNQHINVLTFTKTTGGLDITAPSGPILAPPGHYMLFLLNDKGTPSVAKIIHID